ncbi:MAG: putative ABC transport system permease protein [Planctomycetota bacterium]|jgi:putative ABC transport system permease protein
MLFFVACLAIGVAAVTGVASLIESVKGSLGAESRELIAADLKISSRAELPEQLLSLIQATEPLASTRVWELATMLGVASDSGSPQNSRLVELKAVGPGYPFYGSVVTLPPGLRPAMLEADEMLVSSELMTALQLKQGDSVQVGGQTFRVVGSLLSEPDRLEFGISLGPRVMISNAGLEQTSLLEFGSRVQYIQLLRYPVDQSAEQLASKKEQVVAGLDPALRIRAQTHREAQPSVKRWLENVERYLGLIALLSLILGGVGVAQVVRVWILERTPAVAIQRSLGMRPREILQLYVGHVLGLALLASFIGCLVGACLPFCAALVAPEFFGGKTSLLPSLVVFARGLGLGLGIATIFALGPLTAIYKVSPARVLRSEAAPLGIPLWVRFLCSVLLLAGLFGAAWIQAEDPKIAGFFSGGLIGLVLLLIFGARLAMWLATRIPRDSMGIYLRHGLASLARPGAGTIATVVALGLGVHVITTMLLVEHRLSEELRNGLPEEAPSIFLVDVQSDQWPGVQELLKTHDASYIDNTPVCMARLSHIDGDAVREIAADRETVSGRERWVLTREQRLTWRKDLPDSNTLIDGHWFQNDDVQEVSLEERFAKSLGAQLGTRLTFDLQGVPIEFMVTSIRDVDWASFSINFFLIVEPGSLDGAPYSHLASARLQADSEQPLQNKLVADFNNVTLLRLRPMLEKVAGIMERIALGVRSLGLISVVAGLAILCGTVAAGGLRRKREIALQKTLGMTRMGVAIYLGVEYAMIGGVAGLCGASAAYLLSWGFLHELMAFDPQLPWSWLPAFVLASALLATCCGLLSSARALAVRPALSLR